MTVSQLNRFRGRLARTLLVLVAVCGVVMAGTLILWPRRAPANPPPPNAPSSLTVSALSGWTNRLTWTDNSGDETGFKIYRKISGGSYSQLATRGSNGTSSVTWDDTSSDIKSNTQYTYYVIAYNDAGDSSASNEASATTALATLTVASTQSIGEASGPLSVQITLSRASSQSASVNYATSSGTATSGSDFTSTSGTSTFSAGDTTKNISVPITNDSLDENNETFTLALSSPSGASLGSPSSQTVTITDDDQLPDITIPIASQTVSEAVGNAVVTVTLSAASGRTVSVDYLTGGFIPSATAGEDYTSQSGTLTFTAGQTSKTISIPIINDSINEEDETFSLIISNPVNATINVAEGYAGWGFQDITIDDNDVPAAPSMSSATTQSSTSVAVAWTEVDPADGYKVYHKQSGGSYSLVTTITGNGTTSYTDTGLLANTQYYYKVSAWDSDGEGSQSSNEVNATTSAPTISISSGANPSVAESAGSISVSVTLSTASSQQVTVNYATTAVTATAGTDYTTKTGTLTFTAGTQTLTQSVSIAIAEDSLDEDDETFTFAISSPSGGTLGTPTTATITITDNDALPNLTIAATSQTVSEAAGNAVVTVALSPVSGRAVTAHYYTTAGTATGGGTDYTSQNGTLTIAAGQTSGTISIPITSDTTNEVDETFVFTIDTPGNCTIDASGPSPGSDSVTVTIDDDDVPVAPTMSSATTQSATSIAVAWTQVTPSDGYKVYRKPSGGSYSMATTITGNSTTSYTDTGLLANQQYYYKVSAWDADGEGAQSSNEVNATTSMATVSVSAAGSSSVAESGGSISATIALSTASGAQVTVAYATASATAASGSDFTSTSGTATFTVNGALTQTVSIPILQDSLDEDDETFTFTISSPSGATLGTTTSRTFTITDDDPLPNLTIAATSQTVGEAAGNAVVTVALSPVSGRSVTAHYYTTAGTATGGGTDYASQNGTLTIAAAQSSGTISVPITNDTANEVDETFVLTIDTAGNCTIDASGPAPGTDSVTITIDDNDVPVAPTMSSATTQSSTSIAVAWTQVTPADGYYVYRKPSGGSYTLATTITGNGSSTPSWTDTGLLANQQYYYKVSAWDSDGEGAQSSNEVNATTSLPTVTLSSAGSDIVAESVGSISIDLNLSTASGADVTVAYTTADGTATAGSDYTTRSGTATFGVGEALTQTVSIPILEDTVNEEDETFTFTISSPSGAMLGSTTSRTFTINDNDLPSTPTLSSVTAIGLSTIRLAWTPVAWADGYEIERKLGADGSYELLETISGNSTTSYDDQDLPSGQRYYYKFRAYDEDGYSDYSGEVSAATHMTPPMTLTAGANVTSATLATNLSAAFGSYATDPVTNMGAGASSTFTVHGGFRGRLSGSYSGNGTSTPSFDPAANLMPGEELEMTLTAGLQSTMGGTLLRPFVWRLRGASGASAAISTLDTVMLNDSSTSATAEAAGDLDGDGKIDLVVGSIGQTFIYRNIGVTADGQTSFTVTALGGSSYTTASLALADLNGDGKLDIVLGRWGAQSRVFLNPGDGSMNFGAGVALGSAADATSALAAGDVDGDGDMDLVVALYGEQSRVYLNDGSGNFTSTINFGGATDPTMAVALADVDGHGDLDIIAGNFGAQSKIYVNNGSADFGLALDFGGATDKTRALAVGDLDLDGDVDIAVGNDGGQSRVYFNSGSGVFNSSEPFGGPTDPTHGLALADIDGDGDLDLLVANCGAQSRAYFNLAAGAPQLSVFRPDTETLSTPSRNGWWPASWGTGTQRAEYVTDSSRGQVVRLSTTASGEAPGDFLIGESYAIDINPNDDPLMPTAAGLHSVMGLWMKANGSGQVLQFLINADTGTPENPIPITMNLYAGDGNDSADGSDSFTFRIGSGYNDGSWHYAVVDLQARLSALASARTITAIYGIEVLARDVYVDDIVFFDNVRTLLGEGGRLIGGAADMTCAVVAADLTGSGKLDISAARMGLESSVQVNSAVSKLGALWPRALNNNADSDGGASQAVDWDVRVRLAGGRNIAGDKTEWIAVWVSNTDVVTTSGATTGTDGDILFARSEDMGANWSDPQPLNGNATSNVSPNYDTNPDIAHGDKRWVAVWESQEDIDLGQGAKGSDQDILASYSIDDGANWSQPILVNSGGLQGTALDMSPRIAYGGNNTWVVVWVKCPSWTEATNRDEYYSISTDGGLTWSTEALIDPGAGDDNRFYSAPSIASDGNGNFIAVWDAPSGGSPALADSQLFVSKLAKNDAGEWRWNVKSNGQNGPPFGLANEAGVVDGAGGNATIAADGTGGWVIIYTSERTSLPGVTDPLGGDQDLFAYRSTSNGNSWTGPTLVNSNATTDNEDTVYDDNFPQVVGLAPGHFVAVWQSRGGDYGQGFDALCSFSSDGGSTWSPIQPANLDAWFNAGTVDKYPVIAGDGMGNLMAAWESTDGLGGNLCSENLGTDWDILYSPILLNPPKRTLTIESIPVAGAPVDLGSTPPADHKYVHGQIMFINAPEVYQGRDFVKWTIGGCARDEGQRWVLFTLDRDIVAQPEYAYQPITTCPTLTGVLPNGIDDLAISWDDVPYNAEKIRIYYSANGGTESSIDVPVTSPYTLNNLSPGTYTIRLKGWNPLGLGPCASDSLEANTKVRLTVAATGAPEGATVNFAVTVGQSDPVNLEASSTLDVPYGSEIGVTAPGFPLRDFVWKKGTEIQSFYGNPISATLESSQTITAQYSSGLTAPILDQPQADACGISLSWTDRSITWSEDRFQIYRRRTNPNEETDFTLIGSTIGPHLTSFVDDLGLEVGATYEYAVRASWGPLLSDLSNLKSVDAAMVAPPVVIAAIPAPETVNVDMASGVGLGFTAAIATPTAPLILYGSMSGKLAIDHYSPVGTTAFSASPSAHFKAGELVEVTAVDHIHTTAEPPGNLCSGYVWQFRAEVGGYQPVTPNFAEARPFGPRIGATRALAIGDLDHDDLLDIVAGNAGGSFVYINSGGSFSPDDNPPRPLGTAEDATLSVVAVALGDMNADLSLDVVALVEGGQSKIYWNDGTGNFGTGTAFGPSASGVTSVAVGDMNGDGFLDIVVGILGARKVVYLNDGSGGFPDELARPFGSASESTMAVALADFNRDGHLDVAVGNYGQQSLVYLNDGFGNLTPGPGFGQGTESTYALAVGDVTGLGHADIVMGNHGGLGEDADAGEESVIYKSLLPDGTFTGFELVDTLATADPTTAVALADLNGDGNLDLVVANDSETASAYALINPSGNLGHFSGATPIAIGPASPNWAIAIGDVGGSGVSSKLDVALGGLSGQSAVYVSLAVTPDPTPSPTATPTYSNVPDFCTPAGTDVTSTPTPTAANLRPRAINDYARGDTGGDTDVSIATDGKGHWVAVWASDENIYIPGRGPVGPDRDIFISRMWAPPTRPAPDSTPGLETDGWHQLFVDVYGASPITGHQLGDTSQGDFIANYLYKWMEARPLTEDMMTDFSPNSASTIISDLNPHVETDGHGRWMVVWLAQTDGLGDPDHAIPYKLVHSFSTNNSLSWSPRATVRTALTGTPSSLEHIVEPLSPLSPIRANPQIVCDRKSSSTWILVWDSWKKSASSTTFDDDTDYDLLTTQITISGGLFPVNDDGYTAWGAVKHLNTQTASENAQPAQDGGPSGLWENGASLATDGHDNWIAVWHSDLERVATDPNFPDALVNVGRDLDILYSKSTDNGVNWSPPVLLNSFGASDNGIDSDPKIDVWWEPDPDNSANGTPHWVVVWRSAGPSTTWPGALTDIYSSRMVGMAGDWSRAARISGDRVPSDHRINSNPTLASDGKGYWVAAWIADNEQPGEHLNAHPQIRYTRSGNDGITWEDQSDACQLQSGVHWGDPPYTNGVYPGDTWNMSPKLVSDRAYSGTTIANFLLGWEFVSLAGGEWGQDPDILNARSSANLYPTTWPLGFEPPTPTPSPIPTQTPVPIEAASATYRFAAAFPIGGASELPDPTPTPLPDMTSVAADDTSFWPVPNPGEAVSYAVVLVNTATLTSADAISRVQDLAFKFTIDTNFEAVMQGQIWLFKGGYRSGADWHDPTAWSRVGSAVTIQNQTDPKEHVSVSLSENQLQDNLIQYFATDTAEIAGLPRELNSLMFAIQLWRTEGTIENFNFDQIKVELTNAVIPTPVPTPPPLPTPIGADPLTPLYFAATLDVYQAGSGVQDNGPGSAVFILDGTNLHYDITIDGSYPATALRIGSQGTHARRQADSSITLPLNALTDGHASGDVLISASTLIDALLPPLGSGGDPREGVLFVELYNNDTYPIVLRGQIELDSDTDGVSDWEEIHGYLGSVTDPYDRDSDDDGLSDGEEARHTGRAAFYTFNSNVKFYDRGHWPDPALWDTDGDGLSDGVELGVNGKIKTFHAKIYQVTCDENGDCVWTTPDGDAVTIYGTEGDTHLADSSDGEDFIHDLLGYWMRDNDYQAP